MRVDVFPSTLIDGAKAKGGVDGVVLEVEAWRTFRGNEWGNKGEKMGVSREVDGWVKVEGVRPLGGKEYYVQRAGCKFLFSMSFPLPKSKPMSPAPALSIYEIKPANIQFQSLTTLPSQEPNDPHRRSIHDHRLRHALYNG